MLKGGSRRNTRVKHFITQKVPGMLPWNAPSPPAKWTPETLTTPALQESDLRLPRAYRQPSLHHWGSPAPKTDSSPTPAQPWPQPCPG